MTLVETTIGESDGDFCLAADAALQALVPERSNWWHPYEVRGTYECRQIRFRHFYCIAGSVELWMWTIAMKHRGRRVILLSDQSATVFEPLKIYGHGEEVVIARDEVIAV